MGAMKILTYRNNTPIGLKVSEFRPLKRRLEREEQIRTAKKSLRERFFGPILKWLAFDIGRDETRGYKIP